MLGGTAVISANGTTVTLRVCEDCGDLYAWEAAHSNSGGANVTDRHKLAVSNSAKAKP